MSWEALGAGIFLFVCLLLTFFVYLVWRLYCEVKDAEEKRMDKQRFESGINTPLGSVEASASGNLDEGLTAGMSASVRPDMTAAASGIGGAAAYNILLGVAGAWTIPLLLGTAGAVWLYKKQAAAKRAKEFPPPPPGPL